MARKNSVVSVEASESAIVFQVEGLAPINLTLATLADDVRNRAMVHGLIQKISDAAALPKNDDGTAASPADKHAAMQSVVNRLLAGDWNKRGDSTGETTPSGLIRRATFEWVKASKPDITDEKFATWFEAKDRKAVLALRSVPEIAEIMDRMKAERGPAKSIDTDALLAEI